MVARITAKEYIATKQIKRRLYFRYEPGDAISVCVMALIRKNIINYWVTPLLLQKRCPLSSEGTKSSPKHG